MYTTVQTSAGSGMQLPSRAALAAQEHSRKAQLAIGEVQQGWVLEKMTAVIRGPCTAFAVAAALVKVLTNAKPEQ